MKEVVHLATILSFDVVVVGSRNFICLPPTGITTNILPWVCWNIWISRNLLIFEDRRRSPEEVALLSITNCREWLSAQPTKIQPRSETNQQLQRTPIALVPSTTVRCNTDAAWSKDHQAAGLGWVFSFPQSGSSDRGSKAQKYVSSPLMAEALACRSSLHHALSLGPESLYVLSDNQTLIRAIKSKLIPSEIFGIVADIKCLSASFLSVFFYFVPRSQNSIADAIAKASLNGLICNMGSSGP